MGLTARRNDAYFPIANLEEPPMTDRTLKDWVQDKIHEIADEFAKEAYDEVYRDRADLVRADLEDEHGDDIYEIEAA